MYFKKLIYFCTASGEMAEWSNAAVLKTVVPRGTGGSNPSLSATIHQSFLVDFFCSNLLITFCFVKVLSGSFLGKYGSFEYNFDDILRNYVLKCGFSHSEAAKSNEIFLLFMSYVYSYLLLMLGEKNGTIIPFEAIAGI